MKTLTPYLNFPGTTEEAFNFYAAALGGTILDIARFRDFGDEMAQLSPEDLDKVANMALSLPNGSMMMGTDFVASLGQALEPGNDFSLHVEADSVEEAQQIFGALAEGGTVNMEPAGTSWAQWFAGCTDKFGVEWMVSFTGAVVFGG